MDDGDLLLGEEDERPLELGLWKSRDSIRNEFESALEIGTKRKMCTHFES